jgi:DNA segregation ATPase FtsK/SpoIIIE-like protein
MGKVADTKRLDDICRSGIVDTWYDVWWKGYSGQRVCDSVVCSHTDLDIVYSHFTLPKININFRIDDKPAPRKEEPRKSTVERYYDESPKHHSTHEMGAPISASVIKTMLKQKVQEKIAEKEEKNRPVVSFSKDKPTFDISLMQTNIGQTATIDETFLMEKAKALQSKLMEFGVAIQIDGFDIGPSIVQLRIKPDAGIKLSSIESLKDDISSSLKTKSLRIIAPILVPIRSEYRYQIPNQVW